MRQREGRIADARRDERLAEHHLAGHPPEHASAEPDDPRPARHQRCEEPAAPHHDRQREPDAERDEHEIACGSPATASKLSRLIAASARTMIQIASASGATWRTWASSWGG